jgi:alpha-beta hydrolase superfamily lysophospholipase
MATEGMITSRDGTQLFFRRISPSGAVKGRVLCIHGYGDHSGRYVELMESFAAAGLDVLGFDLRGHGKSQGMRGYIKHFSEYLDDCRAACAELMKGAPGRALVFGHSMGGLIATHLVAGEPEIAKALAIGSPLFARALEVNPLKLAAGHLLGRILPKFSLPTGLVGEHMTHDPAEIKILDDDPMIVRDARAGWFIENDRAMAEAPDKMAQITIPLYCMHGEADPVTSFSVSKANFEKARSTDKRFVPLAGMRHEVIHEIERAKVIKDVTDWIVAHA